jgi:tetratricopeptide (TPR) repeat protein
MEARKNFENALSIYYGDYYVWEYYMETLIKTEDYATIASKGNEISELFPTNALFLYTLGYAYDKMGTNTENAIECLHQASLYAVDLGLVESICDLLGDIYIKLDNKTEALKNWKKAIRRPGTNAQKIREKIAKVENE